MRTSNLTLKAASLIVVSMIAATLMCLAVFSSTAFAGDVEIVNTLKSKTVKISYLSGKPAHNKIEYYCFDKKVSNVKSSKKSVATAKLKYTPPKTQYGFTEPAYYRIVVQLKKAGTTKISFKLGSKKYTTTLKVFKYSSPIKSIKIAGKEYSKLFAAKKLARGIQSYGAMTPTATIKGKVKVVAAKGWKLNKIYYEKWKNVGKPTQKIVKTVIKNGSTVNDQFCVEMKNKKSGLIERFWVYPDYSQYMNY